MKRESASERYLRQATSGLWGRRRLEVREELAGHLTERVTAYRLGGLSEEDATERALAELGAPQHVSHGMMRIHTLPTVMGSSLALIALCVAVVALWPKGVAQSLAGTFYWPSAECIQALDAGKGNPQGYGCMVVDNSLWINMKALEHALEPQKVTFSKAPSNLPSYQSVTFPNSTPIYVSLGQPNISVSDKMGREILLRPDFLSFWDFIQSAAYQKDLWISIEGWNNPKIRFNDVSLRVGTDARPMAGFEFFENYLDAVFFKELINPVPGEYIDNVNPRTDKAVNPAFDEEALHRRVLQVKGGVSGVYGIITRLDVNGPFAHQTFSGETPWDVSFMLSVTRPSIDKSLDFELPGGDIHFVDAFAENQPQGTSILVRLAGGNPQKGGWYEVVSPESVSLETP